jgi:hypothetical protein
MQFSRDWFPHPWRFSVLAAESSGLASSALLDVLSSSATRAANPGSAKGGLGSAACAGALNTAPAEIEKNVNKKRFILASLRKLGSEDYPLSLN